MNVSLIATKAHNQRRTGLIPAPTSSYLERSCTPRVAAAGVGSRPTRLYDGQHPLDGAILRLAAGRMTCAASQAVAYSSTSTCAPAQASAIIRSTNARGIRRIFCTRPRRMTTTAAALRQLCVRPSSGWRPGPPLSPPGPAAAYRQRDRPSASGMSAASDKRASKRGDHRL
jgi:hypothetical protein